MLLEKSSKDLKMVPFSKMAYLGGKKKLYFFFTQNFLNSLFDLKKAKLIKKSSDIYAAAHSTGKPRILKKKQKSIFYGYLTPP